MSAAVAPAGAEGSPRADRERPITVTRLTTETGEPITGSEVALNERGQVAGTLYRTEPLESVVVLWHQGRVTRVSPEGVYAHPHDLSDRGHVVGDIYGLDEAQGMYWPHYPFWWSRGEWRQISSDNIAGRGGLDVNRRGQVVTQLDTPPYTGVWDRGEVILPPPGFGAERINDQGQVMGGVRNEAGEAEAATWRLGSDRVTRLGTLGGQSSRGVAINERGDIAGNSTTADGTQHAFLWRHGEMIDLGTLGGEASFVADLNDRGDVVGTSITAEGEGHAFLWRDGEMIDLGSLGAINWYPASEAVAINNHGQVVGNASDHVFLWENGRMTDIGILADEGRSHAVDINDRGQILGWADFGDWPAGAVLWTAPPSRGP